MASAAASREEDDYDRAFREAVSIVRPLAAERAKPWPRLLIHQQRHQSRISDLEAELKRVADRIGWTANKLEKVVREEIARRGRYVPAARPAIAVLSPEQREANLAVQIARDAIAETERLIGVHQARLAKQQIDLARKREAARAVQNRSARS